MAVVEELKALAMDLLHDQDEGDPAEISVGIWLDHVADLKAEQEETGMHPGLAYDILAAQEALERLRPGLVEAGEHGLDKWLKRVEVNADILEEATREFDLDEWRKDLEVLRQEELESLDGADPGFVIGLFMELDRAQLVLAALNRIGEPHAGALARSIRSACDDFAREADLFLSARNYCSGMVLAARDDLPDRLVFTLYLYQVALAEAARMERVTGPLPDDEELSMALAELAVASEHAGRREEAGNHWKGFIEFVIGQKFGSTAQSAIATAAEPPMQPTTIKLEWQGRNSKWRAECRVPLSFEKASCSDVEVILEEEPGGCRIEELAIGDVRSRVVEDQGARLARFKAIDLLRGMDEKGNIHQIVAVFDDRTTDYGYMSRSRDGSG